MVKRLRRLVIIVSSSTKGANSSNLCYLSLLLLPENQFSISFSITRVSSMILVRSATVSALSMAILVWRKSGMPLNKGLAAKWRLVCRIPRFSSSRSTLIWSCSRRVSIFSSSVSGVGEKSQGQPNVARPIITASTP